MKLKKSTVNIGKTICRVVQFNYKSLEEKRSSKNKMHFIQILDRSGSMTPHIHELVENVKRTIDVMDINDLLTVIWFSGPGQCKVLLKGASPADGNLKKQLDKLKSTIGTTCFSEAILEAKEVIKDLEELCSNFVVTLFTDGEPVVPWSIVEEENRVRNILNEFNENILAFNTIGYGGYYNINFLKGLANLSRFGRHSHSTKIDEYLPIFTHNFKSVEDVSQKMLHIKCEGKTILYLNNKTSRLDKNHLKINLSLKSTNKFYIISTSNEEFNFQINEESFNTTSIKSKLTELDIQNLLYALAYEEYYRGNTYQALDILKDCLKDKYLVKTAINAFTAKERQRCTDILQHAAVNKKISLKPRTFSESRLMEGKMDSSEAFDEICFMDLLEIFEKNNDKYIPVSSEQYKRIGKKIIDDYNAFQKDKDEKIIADFKNLVFTKEKLNISIRYEIPGSITINPKQAKAVGFKDNKFKAKIYREQTLIKDGEINVEQFDILASKATMEFLKTLKVEGLYSTMEKEAYLMDQYIPVRMDISKIPVLNRNYILKSDSLKYILEVYTEQRTAECKQKVTKYFIDKLQNINSYEGMLYTKEQIELLKSYGFTNGVYQGIDNKPANEGTDEYECRFFEFSLKGFSNLPKVEDVIEKMNDEKKKLNKPEKMMAEYIQSLMENNLQSDAAKLEKLLEEQKKKIRANTRMLAQIKLAKVLTGGWWQDLKLDSKGNYYYEGKENILIIKVTRKIVKI